MGGFLVTDGLCLVFATVGPFDVNVNQPSTYKWSFFYSYKLMRFYGLLIEI